MEGGSHPHPLLKPPDELIGMGTSPTRPGIFRVLTHPAHSVSYTSLSGFPLDFKECPTPTAFWRLPRLVFRRRPDVHLRRISAQRMHLTPQLGPTHARAVRYLLCVASSLRLSRSLISPTITVISLTAKGLDLHQPPLQLFSCQRHGLNRGGGHFDLSQRAPRHCRFLFRERSPSPITE
jgi:hypothetical protein